MKVIRARVLGYCMGVRRAADLAWAHLDASGGGRVNPPGIGRVDPPNLGRVFTMGPLIHNPTVLADLERRGVEILDENDLPPDSGDGAPIDGATVIIRAHGITPGLEAELVRRGARVVDATCPRVKVSQMKAKTLSAAGYTVFLAGEKLHGEISGIMGYAPGCIVVANREEAEAAAKTVRAAWTGAQAGRALPPLAAPLRAALLAQTTLSPEEYRSIGEGIAAYIPQVEMINTICDATRERQDSLRELCEAVDAVVIAGGRASANTRRLKAIALACGKPAWLVESPEELPPELGAYAVAGLSAGASTPEETIDDVERALWAR